MRWIVFSRHRPYQLYGLLLSAAEIGRVPLDSITVLCRYDDDYRPGLEIVREVFPQCRWVDRTNFDADLQAAIDTCGRTMAFATDDSLFTRRVQWTVGQAALHNTAVVGFSHRLGLHLRRCYPVSSDQPLPQFSERIGLLAWSWRGAPLDWGVIGSIDATQYRTSDVREWVAGARSPTDVEDRLNAAEKSHRPLAMCAPLAAYVTNPQNLVQAERMNRHGTTGVEELYRRFMAGQRPDISKVAGLVNQSCHQEVEI